MHLFATPNLLVLNVGFLLFYIFLFFFAKWIKGMFSSYNLDAQLTEYDNNAVSVSVAGYFIGVTAIFIGAFSETSPVAQLLDDGTREVVDIALDRDTLIEFLEVAGYSLAGVFLLLLARLINQKMILTKFSVDKEIIGDQNPGTGVVEGATYVASGLIIGGAVHGEGGGPITALVFYLLGQLCLVLFAQLYAKLTPYDLHDEIEKDNTAAGLGFAGGLISIGVIVMRAVSGNFSSWAEDLATLGFDILIIFVYLIAIRFIFDRFVVRNSNLNTEIAEDHNLGAGLLEMVVSISFSAVLYFVL